MYYLIDWVERKILFMNERLVEVYNFVDKNSIYGNNYTITQEISTYRR